MRLTCIVGLGFAAACAGTLGDTDDPCGLAFLKTGWHGQSLDEHGKVSGKLRFVLDVPADQRSFEQFKLLGDHGNVTWCAAKNSAKDPDSLRGGFAGILDTKLPKKHMFCSWKGSLALNIVNIACVFGTEPFEMPPLDVGRSNPAQDVYAFALEKETGWFSSIRQDMAAPLTKHEIVLAYTIESTDDVEEWAVRLEEAQPKEEDESVTCTDDHAIETSETESMEIDQFEALLETQFDLEKKWGQDQLDLLVELLQPEQVSVEPTGTCGVKPFIIKVYMNGGVKFFLYKVNPCETTNIEDLRESIRTTGSFAIPKLFTSRQGQLHDIDTGDVVADMNHLSHNCSIVFRPDIVPFMWPPVAIGYERKLDLPKRQVVLETVSVIPAVFKVKNYLTSEEADIIVSSAKDHDIMKPSEVLPTSNDAGSSSTSREPEKTRHRNAETGWIAFNGVQSDIESLVDVWDVLKLDGPKSAQEATKRHAEATYIVQMREKNLVEKLQKQRSERENRIRDALIKQFGEADGSTLYMRTFSIRRMFADDSTEITPIPEIPEDHLLHCQTEPLQIVHYKHGQHYYHHTDPAYGFGALRQRFVTALMYLNDVPLQFGGGTNFPHAHLSNNETANTTSPLPTARDITGRIKRSLSDEEMNSCTNGITVQASKGDAIFFYNLKADDLSIDLASTHVGCDVTDPNQEKWAANLWIHVHPALIPVPKSKSTKP